MTIEELRDKLETEVTELTRCAREENQPQTENHLIGQRYMCTRVIGWIEATYSDEEEG